MATTDMLSEKVRDLQNRVGPEMEEARRELETLNARVVGFIKERPVTSLAIAVAAGFLFGRIASR
jgi:hypothetical protein